MTSPDSKSSHPLAGKEDEIERRYRSGESMPSIAGEFGVSKQAIQKLLGKRGVAFTHRRAVIDARIRELTTQGATVPSIASEVGLTAQTVRNTLRRMYLEPTWETPKRHRLPNERTAEILLLRAEGLTIREIAETLGISPSFISARLIQNGQRSQARRPKSPPD